MVVGDRIMKAAIIIIIFLVLIIIKLVIDQYNITMNNIITRLGKLEKELIVEKKMNKLLNKQIEIAENEIMRRDACEIEHGGNGYDQENY